VKKSLKKEQPKDQLKKLLVKHKKILSQAVDKPVKTEQPPPPVQNIQPLLDEVSKRMALERSLSANKTKSEPLPEFMYVDMAPQRESKPGKLVPKETDTDVMVVSLLDIKGTRSMILNNWRKYTPEKIVSIMREYYTNMRSLAVMLSRLKRSLAKSKDPPDSQYLSQICLSKKEYAEIRNLNSDIRKRGALAVVVIANADLLLTQAMQYMCSDDPNLLYAGVLLVSGLRPIEAVKLASFSTTLNNKQGEHSAWWACQTRFAKRQHENEIQSMP
jgi:hypothetical protein